MVNKPKKHTFENTGSFLFFCDFKSKFYTSLFTKPQVWIEIKHKFGLSHETDYLNITYSTVKLDSYKSLGIESTTPFEIKAIVGFNYILLRKKQFSSFL